ncbi:MAG: hypothetical protein JL50_05275 [Peptococcaceae bacterium BICA1-7]|nr:MAG: hypothetical protein JL50_05275 [Peptococcaceae bacterium BICA1-7]HBV96027.1 hypothetical protein [Desulfotomaculum sp.]
MVNTSKAVFYQYMYPMLPLLLYGPGIKVDYGKNGRLAVHLTRPGEYIVSETINEREGITWHTDLAGL